MLAAHNPPLLTCAVALTLRGAETLPLGGEAVGPVQAESAPAVRVPSVRRKAMPKIPRNESDIRMVSLYNSAPRKE
jgi:hypothetical protein